MNLRADRIAWLSLSFWGWNLVGVGEQSRTHYLPNLALSGYSVEAPAHVSPTLVVGYGDGLERPNAGLPHAEAALTGNLIYDNSVGDAIASLIPLLDRLRIERIGLFHELAVGHIETSQVCVGREFYL